MGEKGDGTVIGVPSMLMMIVIDWGRYVFVPLSLVRESFEKNLQNDIGSLVRAYWGVPITLSVATDAVVLHLYGVSFFSDPAFSLLYLTLTILKFLFGAFILYGVLRLMNAPATQGIAFVCFSIFVIYSPLFAWGKIPQAVHVYDVLLLLKGQHLTIRDALSYFLTHAVEIDAQTPVPTIAPIFRLLTYTISLFSSMMVAECLTQMILTLTRTKAYVATAVATVLTSVPGVMLGIFQSILILAYISDAFLKNQGG
jgi:hypothetical protein